MPESFDRIILGSSVSVRDEAITQLVSAGRGSLEFILGDDACRHRLLGASINWDRLLLAFKDSTVLGYAAFKFEGRGPFNVQLKDFVREFGRFAGALRYALFCLSERRENRYQFFLYGLRVIKPARHQGIASALLGQVFEQAKAVGAPRVDLEILRRNQAARKLYLENGFVGRRWPWPLKFPIEHMTRRVEVVR
jgi:GNAT superfamily N-acetyltransferase